MGKSPGRWIKTLLFGKKTRSHATKGRDASKAAHDKGCDGGKDPALAVNSPVISEPVPIIENNRVILTSDTGGKVPVISHVSQGVIGSTASDSTNNGIEEQAAIKAQAAFRGYLARRAFHALKGIIRLQALIRGHLVRRQAVVTLRAMEGIVKLQAIARGRKVRSSFTNLKVAVNFSQVKNLDPVTQDCWKVKFLSNAFLSKLLSSSLLAKPLQVQYDKEDPNSVFSWLERWTTTYFCQPIAMSKKAVDSKAEKNQINRAVETESGKSRRSMRSNSISNIDAGHTNNNSEPEKMKRNMKKVPNSPVETVQEHPQSELERVKRNLRKISSAMKDTPEQPEVETQKSDVSSKRVAAIGSPENLGQEMEESTEKPKKDIAPTPSVKPETENAIEPVVSGSVDVLIDDKLSDELQLMQKFDKVENTLMMNGELSLNEEQICDENQKISNRRSSFSAKSEHPENGMPNIPVLPSYMAATKSAKAKLRGQISPRVVSESVDKSGFTRRHSLPSSTDGKMSSPRPKRLNQAGAKGGVNRDLNEKPIQVGWRR
ncbi:protein IQ-DOMAIN 31 [Canna indica]|uniref:Protein IQ-DOMAIN 31 n=1 Tax=Canna indica TaxID=4628 RepID=A0AAQ3KKT5_9LILI|nr:protein IQ-DOMAIN 31 [Canna indica]